MPRSEDIVPHHETDIHTRIEKATVAGPRLSPWRTIRILISTAWTTLRKHGTALIPLVVLCQVVVALLAIPLIQLIFRGALAAAGLNGFDLAEATTLLSSPLSLLLLALVAVVALLAISGQLCVLVFATYRLQSGLSLRRSDAGSEARRLLRALARPGSLLLLLYLFLVLPLGNAGFVSVLTQGVAIPNFVSGELLKSASGTMLYLGFLLVVGYLNIRFILTLPAFVAAPDGAAKSAAQDGAPKVSRAGTRRAGAARALATSWRLTRRQSISTVLSLAAVLIVSGIAFATLVTVGLLPTLLSDLFAPAASPVVAAFSLAAVEVIGFILAAVTVQFIVAFLVAFYRLRMGELVAASPTEASASIAQAKTVNIKRVRTIKLVGALCAAGIVVGLGVVNVPVMNALNVNPESAVLGHRGFGDGGVENTIPGLEAASKAGADFVEIDVLETKDRRFVVMHDSNLARLAGRDVHVGDLTLDELTAITVRDSLGHSARIPSLADYIHRAQELKMPLLIEIKLHGKETPDHLSLLVKELDELDAITPNIFHSLDKGKIEGLKRIRPDAYAGYILALAAVGLPKTTADFYVVEEFSYTSELRDQAWDQGKAMFVWTVNEDSSLRSMLRDEVDGIITDRPDVALREREEIQDDDGLLGTLSDAISRFVLIF